MVFILASGAKGLAFLDAIGFEQVVHWLDLLNRQRR
jgi:hypothetical protein